MQSLDNVQDNGDIWSFLEDENLNLFGSYDYELPAELADGFALENMVTASSNEPKPVGESILEDGLRSLSSTDSLSSNVLSRGPRLGLESFTSGSQLEPLVTHSVSPPLPRGDFDPPVCGSAKDNDHSEAARAGKRKLEQSIIVFSASNPEKVLQKKRKAYAPSRRMEVALNRLVGACLQCRIRKGPCNFGIPCDHCLKRAGSVQLGQEICTRQTLVAIRFDHVDLFQVSATDCKIQKLAASAVIGIERIAYIGFRPRTFEDRHVSFISVPLIETDRVHNPQLLLIYYDYFTARDEWVPNYASAIAWRSLLSIERLLQAYKASEVSGVSVLGPFSNLARAFREFASYYCGIIGDVPLQTLLSKTLRMQSLFALFRIGIGVKESLDSPNLNHVSSAMSTQLRYIISKEIVTVEVEVLAQIDKLVFGSETIGRQNPLVIWVCLWTLILSYKDHMVYTDAFYVRERHKFYGLTRHIYNSLTAIYAALYKTTSPLTFDWRTEEIARIMGNDPVLIELFCNIKTEMFWFQAQKELLYAEDALFKTLVVENENKLLAAHVKLAKQQKLLWS